MKKMGTKCISFILIFMMLLQLNITAVFAETAEKISEINNNFVLFRVKTENGRFTIKTKEGSPSRENDKNQNLLFEEKEPETSFTTFRINGKDYIYGNKYGFLNSDGVFLTQPQKGGAKNNISIWKIGDVEITQYLELIDDPGKPNAGNVKIRYEVTNKGSKAAQIGSRILLDTMLGNNDGSAVMLGTDMKPVKKEREISAAEIPQYWRSVDDAYAPSIMGYGFLSGWGNKKPDKMIVGHYQGLSTTKWDYSTDEDMNFTEEDNKYGGADSAVAFYWEPVSIQPQSTQVFETYYGIGKIQEASQERNFNVNLYSPEKLTVNSDKTDYEEEWIDIVVELDNTIKPGILRDVQLSLILGEGLESDGTVLYRHSDEIRSNKVQSYKFRVKAKPQNSYKLLKYRVDVTTSSIREPISFNEYILAPGIKGNPPEIQYQAVTPSNVYYKGDKVFVIKGKGYDFYADKSRWDMFLESQTTGERIKIDREYITVYEDGTQIEVNYPLDLKLGKYEIIMKDSILDTEEKVPYMLTVTDNKKHMARPYGIAAVIKTVTLDDFRAKDFKYEVMAFKNEEDLNNLKESISDYRYIKEMGTGDIEQIMMEFRGNILQTTDENGNKRYSISGNDSVPVVINDFIRYEGNTLSIEKTEEDESLRIVGDGNLELNGGFTFWKGTFKIEFEYGTDYSLNAKSEQDIANILPEMKGELIEDDIEYLYVKDKVRDAQETVNIEFTGIGDIVKNLDGFLLQIGNVTLLEEGITFSGDMALTFIPDESEDPFAFSAEIEDVLFEKDENGKVDYKGISVNTEVELPEDMFGGVLKNGASASLTIDTIESLIELEAQMNIKAIECQGHITVIFKDKKPVLDDLDFFTRFKKSVPLFPPVLNLNGIGGGINDMYSTLTGDKSAPPTKILLMAGLELVSKKLFIGDVKLTVSKVGISIDGELELEPIEETILTDVHAEARWADPWYVDIGAELDILGIVTGGASIYVSGEWFEGKIYASLQVPDDVMLIGGMEFAEAEMGINKKKVWGNVGVNIWLPFKTRRIGVGVAYYWNGGLKVADASGGISGGIPALYSETMFTEEGGPITMLVGTNVTKLADSKQKITVGSLKSYFDTPMVYASLDERDHYFNVYNQEIAVFQFDYEGDMPEFKVYKPDGEEYPIVNPENSEEKAYTIQTGDEKNHVYIYIPEPDNGTWKVEVSDSVESALLEIKEVPVLTSANAAIDGSNEITVNWTAEYAQDSKVNISLVTDEEDSGILLAGDIDANLGTYKVQVPEGTPSGSYKIRAEVKEGDFGYSQIYTDEIAVSDPYQPSAVSTDRINAVPIGNGQIKVEFDSVNEDNITGYYVEVFDEAGNKIESAGEYFAQQDSNSIVIGGKYKVKDIDDNGNEIEKTLGLDTQKTYKFGITALRERNNFHHLSQISYSDLVYLPEPEPANIDVQLQNSYTLSEDEQGETIKVINSDEAVIHFESDKNVKTTVKINESVFDTFQGSSKEVKIPVEDGNYLIECISENEQKDISASTMYFGVDTKAPLLLIESPKEGSIGTKDDIVVSGVTEADTELTVNNKEVKIGKDGYFSTLLSMDDAFRKTITVTAKDKADNITNYETQVYNSSISDIQEVIIKPQIKTMENGTAQQFKLVAIDKDGNEVEFENNMVKWSFIKGETLAELSDEGILTAFKEGEVIVKASYFVSEGYAFEDAIPIKIVKNISIDNITDVIIKPQIETMNKGTSQQLVLAGKDDKGNEITLEPNFISWDLAEGQDLATISSDGLLKANDTGTIRVKGSYSLSIDNSFEKIITINIVNDDNKDKDDDNDKNDKNDKNDNRKINRELQEMLDNIIGQEKGLIVLATSQIDKSKKNKIRAGSKLSLVVPEGAVEKEDALLIGRVKEDKECKNAAKGQKLNLASSIYEIQFAKQSQNLKKPVELIFEFDKDKIENADNLGVYYYNEKDGQWEFIGGNIEDNKITAKVDHFSKYAVMEKQQAIDVNMADISNRWSEKYIKNLILLDVVNGIKENKKRYFKPEKKVTRLELAAMVARMMKADKNSGSEKTPFADWNSIADWGRDYAQIAYENGWIRGEQTDSGLVFAGDKFATRAEVATIIGRLVKDKKTSDKRFADINEIPEWAKQNIDILVSEGIISGYPDGTFKPGNDITREETAKILAVFIQKGLNK